MKGRGLSRWWALLSAAALLAGCADLYIQGDGGRWIGIAPGGLVETRLPLAVPGGRTRVFLQRGRVLPRVSVSAYHPSCDFEVARLDSKARVIQPDLFSIERVDIGTEQVVDSGRTRVAALALRAQPGPGPSIHRYYRFRLLSDAQPEVNRLTCRGALADPAESRLPTLEEVRQALGEAARIELPGP